MIVLEVQMEAKMELILVHVIRAVESESEGILGGVGV
jgi:hypothetical protein